MHFIYNENSQCESQVGRQEGENEIRLSQKCLFNGQIQHEVMHSLGFDHEHSRPDRDA